MMPPGNGLDRHLRSWRFTSAATTLRWPSLPIAATPNTARRVEDTLVGVPFAYYDRLSRREKDLYDRSDRIRRIDLPQAEGLRPIVEVLRQGLARDDRKVV